MYITNHKHQSYSKINGSIKYLNISGSYTGSVFHIPDGCDTLIANDCRGLRSLTGNARTISITDSYVDSPFKVPCGCTKLTSNIDVVYLGTRSRMDKPLMLDTTEEYEKIGPYHVPLSTLNNQLRNYSRTTVVPEYSEDVWDLFGDIMTSKNTTVTDDTLPQFRQLNQTFDMLTVMLDISLSLHTREHIGSSTVILSHTDTKTLILPRVISRLIMYNCKSVKTFGDSVIFSLRINESSGESLNIPNGCRVLSMSDCTFKTIIGHSKIMRITESSIDSNIVIGPGCTEFSLYRCRDIHTVTDNRLDKTVPLHMPGYINLGDTWTGPYGNSKNKTRKINRLLLITSETTVDYLIKIITTDITCMNSSTFMLYSPLLTVLEMIPKVQVHLTDMSEYRPHMNVVDKVITLTGYQDSTLTLPRNCISLSVSDSPALQTIMCEPGIQQMTTDSGVTVHFST